MQTYQGIEKEKIDSKLADYSDSAKKFMGKWAEGIIDEKESSPVRMRASLVEAKSSHSKASIIAVREKSPAKRSNTTLR